jgi:hypothetical protein
MLILKWCEHLYFIILKIEYIEFYLYLDDKICTLILYMWDRYLMYYWNNL